MLSTFLVTNGIITVDRFIIVSHEQLLLRLHQVINYLVHYVYQKQISGTVTMLLQNSIIIERKLQ